MLLGLMIPEAAGQWYGDYFYRMKISIPDENVTGSETFINFPILIDETHGDLKSHFNQGLVRSEDGYDIVFTKSDGTTKLNHEVESYDNVTGHIISWVQVDSLFGDANNYLYLYYGKPGVVLDPSTTDTWDPGAYVAVYHLHDGFVDATTNGNDGSGSGTVDMNALIADGEDFQYEDTNDWIDIGNFNVSNDSLTISAWIKPSSFAQADARIVSKANGENDSQHWWMLSTINNYELRFRLRTDGTTTTHAPEGSVLSVNSWQYVSAVYDGSEMNLFQNGSKIGSGTSKTGPITSSGVDIGIGNQPNPSTITGGPRPFDGIIDEVRIQKAARSSNWLTTEKDNQSDPTSFHQVPDTAEVRNDVPCTAISLDTFQCFKPLNFSNLGATDSGEGDPGCDYSGADVWFKVAIPDNGKVAIEVGTSGFIGWIDTPNHAVYSGICGSLSQIGCYSGNSYVQPMVGSRSVHTGLTPGDSLFIRVWDEGGDENGQFTIAIMNDDVAPTIFNCPDDITQDNDPGDCSAVVTWTEPTYSDNCAIEDAYIQWGRSHDPGATFPVDTTTVTYYFVDLSGDTSFCSFDVMVVDAEDPVVPANGGSTVECIASAVQPSPPPATDNCDGVISGVFVDSVTVPGILTCEGQVTFTYSYTDAAANESFWIYTYLVDYSGGLTAPADDGTTVSCPAQAVDPGAPADITDACGRTVSAAFVDSVTVPGTLTCEGQVIFTYRYTACDGVTTDDWIYTYLVDYSGGLTAPADDGTTVSCPAQAVDPGAPADITDACGRTVSAAFVDSVTVPGTLTCEGQVIFTYRYTACDGVTTDDWIYTYLVDYSGGLTAPADDGTTVSCPAQAVDPGAPADITDACGRTVSAVFVDSVTVPGTLTCEGQVIFTYRYTACDGVTTDDWIYTYLVDYSGGLTAPADDGTTVSCPAQAVDPGAPADITDACGRTVSACLWTR